MVFDNPMYPTLTRTLKRARAREASSTSKRRKTAAAVKIQRAFKTSYARKARLATGENLTSFPAKISQKKSDGWLLFPSNNLNGVDPVSIPRKTTTQQDINCREGDVVYLSGFKLNLIFQNNLSASKTNDGLMMNVALISGKAGASDITTSNFFTSGAGTKRASPFTNVILTPQERHTLPINQDNYVVHWHYRFQQSAAASATNPSTNYMPHTFEINKYIPIRRQMRFDDDDGTKSETPFYLVHWAGLAGEAAASPIVPVADTYKLTYNILNYFREPPF